MSKTSLLVRLRWGSFTVPEIVVGQKTIVDVEERHMMDDQIVFSHPIGGLGFCSHKKE
jgi:hypothetical protein